MNVDKYVKAAVLEEYMPSERLQNIAGVMRYDIMHGPSYVSDPSKNKDWSEWTVDDHATFVSDLEGDPVETYSSPLAEELMDYIENLPSEIWVEGDCVCDSEPEGYYDLEIENPDYDSDDEGSSEFGAYVEPAWDDITKLDRSDIVEILFGRTIAKEFR